MPGWAKAAARILVVAAGILGAYVIAELARVAVLRQLVTPDAQGRYTIDFLKGEGHWLAIANLVSLMVLVLLAALVLKIVYRRRSLDRPVVVLGGYIGACIAAGLALAIAYVVNPGYRSPIGASGLDQVGFFYALTGFASIVIGMFALLPTLPFLIYTERHGVRSPVFYVVAGILVAVLAFISYLTLFGTGPTAPAVEVTARDSVAIIIFAPAGLVAGLTYWLIAGRSTGQGSNAAR